jgi:hypothetical protein
MMADRTSRREHGRSDGAITSHTSSSKKLKPSPTGTAHHSEAMYNDLDVYGEEQELKTA